MTLHNVHNNQTGRQTVSDVASVARSIECAKGKGAAADTKLVGITGFTNRIIIYKVVEVFSIREDHIKHDPMQSILTLTLRIPVNHPSVWFDLPQPLRDPLPNPQWRRGQEEEV